MTTPAMLIAYNAAGEVIATLDYMVAHVDGRPVGLVDFAAHEAANGKLRAIWNVEGAAGSATWPEWLGSRAHEFRVDLAGTRARALVHLTSGHRRERVTVEATIAARLAAAGGRPADIRDLVGGPERPLALESDGRTAARAAGSTPAGLPVIQRQAENVPLAVPQRTPATSEG